MGSHLFAELARRTLDDARHEVEVYGQEIPEYRFVEHDGRRRAEALDYAVWLRRRTLDLAPEGTPLGQEDLDHIASMGASRARTGMCAASRRRVLGLHTNLMLREIQEASGPENTDELMRVMVWFTTQGTRGIDAYTRGHAAEQKRRLPFVARVRALTAALLADDSLAPGLARAVGMSPAASYEVVVVRVPGRPAPAAGGREAIVEALLTHHRMPIAWPRAEELVALVPAGQDSAPDTARPGRDRSARDRALAFVRDAGEAVARPCAVGISTGRVRALADAYDRARRVSLAAPLQPVPHRLHTLADVFVELAVAEDRDIDSWLSGMARTLARGPELLATLETYYAHDMHRRNTAAALNIHPRTLDYRLQRVRRLTDVDPGSARGVRILSTVVARAASGAWTA
ncbi:PucR family transcriptional regulator [Streptomyces javensis]|uniref:Helix-turn-helix domain-containing protein n=1 Tax=Streptomyces javensis TaxID=114698 RepID=A0ABS0RLN9_9ACTN|nr:helix-turn-helix domain-containing protein [Streptomyces javensis]MBI0317626.1 helix-turn-helix domain-containing protein [Streptomyces javensis]